MEKDQLSVIVPMHNCSAYIEECLNGILSQTVTDLEVILVDDGSRDDTLKKAQKYPFKVISLKKQSGVSCARNIGVKESRGKTLIFIDSDVVLPPDAIQRLLISLSKPDTDAVSGIYHERIAQGSFFSQFINLFVIFRYTKPPEFITFIFNCFCAIKREALEAVNGYNENMACYEDVEIGHKLTNKGFHCRLDPTIEVTHLKRYSHLSLLQGYFQKAVFGGAYYRDIGSHNALKEDTLPLSLKVANTSAMLMLVSLLLIKISPLYFLLFLGAYSICLLPLLFYLNKMRSLIFALKSFFFCFEFFLVCQFGFIWGILTGEKKDG